mmetsp:Transcript_1486/g.2063  ORF Transcript_1486/g.2063 Transcript_1486/m.2063 type:complete len:141 (-) Transcript_1486:40-462(-)
MDISVNAEHPSMSSTIRETAVVDKLMIPLSLILLHQPRLMVVKLEQPSAILMIPVSVSSEQLNRFNSISLGHSIDKHIKATFVICLQPPRFKFFNTGQTLQDFTTRSSETPVHLVKLNISILRKKKLSSLPSIDLERRRK